MTPGERALLALLLVGLPALGASLPPALVRRLAPRLGPGLEGLALFLLATTWGVLLAGEVGGAPAGARLAAGLILATGMTWAVRRAPGMGSLLGVAAMAFLLPALGSVLRPPPAPESPPPAASPPPSHGAPGSAPVVLLVLDEIPVTSLMGPDRRVDGRRFPHFAALAARSTWFREALTVHNLTEYAVPSILSGQRTWSSPHVGGGEQPPNLFSLLAPTHPMVVVESEPRVCTEALCGAPVSGDPTWVRLRGMLGDLAVVYLHRLLPPVRRDWLPMVSNRWGGFFDEYGILGLAPAPLTRLARARERFADFLGRIPEAPPGAFLYHHLRVPHGPWSALPSGRVFGPEDIPVADPRDDEWEALREFQMHQLQLGYADRLLGEAVAALERAGILERCLLVVTADHGNAFAPGKRPRDPTPETLAEIYPVPLFLRRPGQVRGEIVDTAATTLDILPTVAAFLGRPVPWEVEGRDLLAPTPTPPGRVIVHDDHPTPYEIPLPFLEKYELLERRLAWMNIDAERSGFFRLGPHGALVGRGVVELPRRPPTDAAFSLTPFPARALRTVPRVSRPLLFTGVLHLPSGSDGPRDLALVVEGRIVVVTHATWDREAWRFSAVLPEDPDPGSLEAVEVFRIHGSPGGAVELELLPRRPE